MPRPIKQKWAGMIDRGITQTAVPASPFRFNMTVARATCRKWRRQPQSGVTECEIRDALQVTGSRQCYDRRAAASKQTDVRCDKLAISPVARRHRTAAHPFLCKIGAGKVGSVDSTHVK